MMLKIGVDVLKDEEKFLEVLYSLENKEEIITILKTRLILGERIPTREIILRSEKIEKQLKNLEVLTKLRFKHKNLTMEGNLESKTFDVNTQIVFFYVYNFVGGTYDRNLTDLYLTKDKKQLYFIDRFKEEYKLRKDMETTSNKVLDVVYTNSNREFTLEQVEKDLVDLERIKGYIKSNTAFALDPDDNKMLIEFIADITLEKNLKDKEAVGYFDF